MAGGDEQRLDDDIVTPHRPAGCSGPATPPPCRPIFWGSLVARYFTQRRRARACHASGSLGRGRQAQAPIKVYPVGRTVETRFRDRDSLYEVQGPLRLIALIKSEKTARKILTAMHLPSEVPKLHPARPRVGKTSAVATSNHRR